MWWFVKACGIEKCVECTVDKNGEDECMCCIKGYSPYRNHHESVSKCVPVLEKQTKQLEDMKEEEEKEQENADLLC